MKLRKIDGALIAVFASVFLFSAPASAQDDDGGPQTQGDDAAYIAVTHVNFKPGKRSVAMEIIAEHFQTATEAAGLPGPMLVIHYQTGKYDSAIVWAMEGGMKDLEWFRSPDDIKWMAALAEQEGGVEAAEALLADFRSMIANSFTEVGHYHTGEEAE